MTATMCYEAVLAKFNRAGALAAVINEKLQAEYTANNGGDYTLLQISEMLVDLLDDAAPLHALHRELALGIDHLGNGQWVEVFHALR